VTERRTQSGAGVPSYDLRIVEEALRVLDETGLPDGTEVRVACEEATRGRDEQSSTFMTKLYASAWFDGLTIQRDKQNAPAKLYWHPLGRALLDTETAPHARREMFGRVPFHAEIAKRFAGRRIDSDEVTNVMRHELKISSGQVNKGRQEMKRSAIQAGLLDDDERLVLPPDVSWVDGEVKQEVSEVMNQASFVPLPSESAATSIAPASVSTPQTPANSLADMDGIINLVVRNLEIMSADEFDAWHRWLDSTIEYAKIRSRKRQ
jgi:hypothetical protein